jgi:hypothetical protein
MVIKQSSSIIEARENENVENRESITWPDTKGWHGTEKTSTTMKVDSSLVLYYTSGFRFDGGRPIFKPMPRPSQRSAYPGRVRAMA